MAFDLRYGAFWLPYYPTYTPDFYTVQHLCQGGGACYQQVHKPELFHIDATGAGTCGAGLENTI